MQMDVSSLGSLVELFIPKPLDNCLDRIGKKANQNITDHILSVYCACLIGWHICVRNALVFYMNTILSKDFSAAECLRSFFRKVSLFVT